MCFAAADDHYPMHSGWHYEAVASMFLTRKALLGPGKRVVQMGFYGNKAVAMPVAVVVVDTD
jgi:hypothetical protein